MKCNVKFQKTCTVFHYHLDQNKCGMDKIENEKGTSPSVS